ncbi:uncharacterized protein E0L32_002564 [Thyridium curvatum]|uniref:Biotrophy-associated secreted protein 2 n=1 Tax=Thyridium curvatum TaxID=1093900 RepID=A0A507BFM6_9PEZI|nr:uncharacterized protein E0L32_002564 [Thyridium curvatum]TPX18707.1 hypothetical protein E0L32_002564 [Thyridium curvatum]
MPPPKTVAATTALAAPQPIEVDPNGAKNLGNGAGTQFITGACLSNADCASGCCASIVGGSSANGICSGPAVGNVAGKGGCGFSAAGGGAAAAPPSSPPPPATSAGSGTTPPPTTGGAAAAKPIQVDSSGAKNVGNGAGKQFITGACLSNADCNSGCCASIIGGNGANGICSGTAVGNVAGKGGCGFSAAGGAGAGAATPPPATANPAKPGTNNNASAGSGTCAAVNASAAGSANVGKGNGQQFITGQCQSAADCASGCCAKQADGSAQCKARLVTEQAGGSCDFSCTAA